MIIELSAIHRKQLEDNIIANHFSDIKYIQAFQNRNEDLNHFLFNDRFCLKNFLQEFNIIRHVCKDKKSVSEENKNIVRLSKLLDDTSFHHDTVDNFAKRLKAENISKVNPISLTSKMYFLGNPDEIFIYDSLVRTAVGLKYGNVTYSQFYSKIKEVIGSDGFGSYVNDIERSCSQKLTLLESWTGKDDTLKIREMRIIDRYLMLLGKNNIRLT